VDGASSLFSSVLPVNSAAEGVEPDTCGVNSRMFLVNSPAERVSDYVTNGFGRRGHGSRFGLIQRQRGWIQGLCVIPITSKPVTAACTALVGDDCQRPQGLFELKGLFELSAGKRKGCRGNGMSSRETFSKTRWRVEKELEQVQQERGQQHDKTDKLISVMNIL